MQFQFHSFSELCRFSSISIYIFGMPFIILIFFLVKTAPHNYKNLHTVRSYYCYHVYSAHVTTYNLYHCLPFVIHSCDLISSIPVSYKPFLTGMCLKLKLCSVRMFNSGSGTLHEQKYDWWGGGGGGGAGVQKMPEQTQRRFYLAPLYHTCCEQNFHSLGR